MYQCDEQLLCYKVRLNIARLGHFYQMKRLKQSIIISMIIFWMRYSNVNFVYFVVYCYLRLIVSFVISFIQQFVHQMKTHRPKIEYNTIQFKVDLKKQPRKKSIHNNLRVHIAVLTIW